MNIIEILPDFIANQIAAGEVVQKPESVIKELVENSIDAGADSIAVVVKGAGKTLIHIVDNGLGMSKEDLLLSVKRHATSKIKSVDDLEQIKTFGFRGEALASIASVASMEIRTKSSDSILGWQLISDPNSHPVINEFNCEKGTQIFVRNLFYNTPARRKFLKSNLTEFRYISDTMIKFGLAHPGIRFTFYDDDTLVFDLKPSDLKTRIHQLLGNTTSDSLMEVALVSDLISIQGYVGQPHLAKQTKSGQYLFLNNRPIISNNLAYAVFSAFEHLLEKNQKPLFILNLTVDFKIVDVNVHPQKHEVKFEDERIVFNAIRRAVHETLERNDLTPQINLMGQDAQTPFERFQIEGDKNFVSVNTLTGEIISNKDKFNIPSESNRNSNSSFKSPSSTFDFNENRNFISAYEDLFKATPEPNSIKDVFNESDAHYWQLHNKYIFVQTDYGVLIIDQHNAHERVLYEKSIKMMNKEFSGAQELLFPVNLKLNSSQITLLKELNEDFLNLGFNFTFETDNSINLSTVPLDVKAGNEERILLEILESYEEFAELKHSSSRENLAATFSCKSAIKTGQKLSITEMKELTKAILDCKMPYVCPHGRAVILNYTLDEFDKSFGRK